MDDQVSAGAGAAKYRTRDALILAFTLFFPALMTWGYFVYGASLKPELSKYIFGFGKTLQFAFPAIVAAFVLKERVWIRRPNCRGLLVGGLFGLAVGATIFFLGRHIIAADNSLTPLFDRLRTELLERLEPFGLASHGAFLVVCLFYSVFHSGLEEYYWRWFAFGRVSKKTAWLRAAILTNLAFTLHHVILLGVYFGYSNWLTWFASFGVFVGGMVWQAIYRRADSVYGAWLSHGLIDAGIFAVGFLLLP